MTELNTLYAIDTSQMQVDTALEPEQAIAGKYHYRIRSANGVVINNLHIYGKSRADADEKIQNMYRRCEILSCQLVTRYKNVSSNYEDVLDAIVGKFDA